MARHKDEGRGLNGGKGEQSVEKAENKYFKPE